MGSYGGASRRRLAIVWRGFTPYSRLNVDFLNTRTGDIFSLHEQLIVESNRAYSVEFNPRRDEDDMRYEHDDGTGPRRFTNYIALGDYDIRVYDEANNCEVTLENVFIRGKLTTRPELTLNPDVGPRPDPWAEEPISFSIAGTGFPANTDVRLMMRDSEEGQQWLGAGRSVETDDNGQFELDLSEANFCCWDAPEGIWGPLANVVTSLRLNASHPSSGAWATAVYTMFDPRATVRVDDLRHNAPDGDIFVVENAGSIRVSGAGFLPNSVVSCEISKPEGLLIIHGENEGGPIGSFNISADESGNFSHHIDYEYWPREHRIAGNYVAHVNFDDGDFSFQQSIEFVLNEDTLEGSGWPDISIAGYEYAQVISRGPHTQPRIPVVSGKETLLRIYYTCDNNITNNIWSDLVITDPEGNTETLFRRDLELRSGTNNITDIDREDINSTVNFLIPEYLSRDKAYLEFNVNVHAERALDRDFSNNRLRARITYETPRDFHTVFRVLHTHRPRQVNRRDTYARDCYNYARDITRAFHLNRDSFEYWFSGDDVRPTFHFVSFGEHWGDEWDNELADDGIMTSALGSAALSEWFDSDPPHDSNDILKWYVRTSGGWIQRSGRKSL